MKARSEKAQEWQITFDAVPDPVMILDDESRIVQVNAAAVAYFNLPLEKILGNHCYSLMDETEAPPLQLSFGDGDPDTQA